MGHLRHIARRSAMLGMLFVVALSMRMVVPGGWMAVAEAGILRIQPCPGWTSARPSIVHRTAHSDHSVHGLHAGHHQDGPDDHGQRDHGTRADQPCASAGLAMAFPGVVQPVTLAPAPARADVPQTAPSPAPTWGPAAPPPPQTGPPLSA